MVCIAAFIILALAGVIVAFLSIFNRELGRKYLKVFKKAWHCVFKKVRLQKCDTNFKDDVKTTLLKKVILKHPTWVKPLSIAIEVLSVLIVVITVWSIVISIKALLALWVFGTCNVSQPSQCSLGAEACSIDQGEPKNLIEKFGRSIGEWGEIFSNIPDRLKYWDASEYLPSIAYIEESPDNDPNSPLPLALDIIDPLCSVCMQSYRNQHSSDFATTHNVAYIYYSIPDGNGGYKFANSNLVVRHLYAPAYYFTHQIQTLPSDMSDSDRSAFINRALNLPSEVGTSIIRRLFTESNDDGISWQSAFNNLYSADTVTAILQQWYLDFGFTPEEVAGIIDYLHSSEVDQLLSEISQIVLDKIHAKGIPTLIYDGRKHNGLYRID